MTRSTLVLAAVAAVLTAGTAGATIATSTQPAPKPPKGAPKPSKPCTGPVRTPSPSSAAPSAQLLDALAVLRRPRAADDELPKDALAHAPYVDGVMVDAARRVAPDVWLLPVADLSGPLEIPERCLRRLDPEQRRATRKAIRDDRARGPEEGVVIAKGQVPAHRHRTQDILAGRAFTLQGCSGPMHDRIAIEGIVADAVTQVTVTSRDGAILQATPDQNLVRFDIARPEGPSGLPAHITSTTAGAPLEYAISPRSTQGLDQPCEPPSRNSIGQRREPPTRLETPAGARIVLQTARWQPEDTGPQVAGATYREDGRRCLLIAPERDLRAGRRAHRFCVDEDRLHAERFIARATRLPSGDVVLEGFVDRRQVSAIVIERSIRPGAHRLPVARGSGAFFMAIRGSHPRGGVFQVHAALRGTPVRYTGLTNVRLSRR